MDARLIHGLDYHVKADIARIAQEPGQVAGIERPHGRHGVALDAGNLHQTADGIAGQPQMMLQRDLGGVLRLFQRHIGQLGQSGGSHGAGCADLRLTAALGAGDRGVLLDQIAENMYLSPFYISKIFKSETGDTPIRHLINIRLEKAKELLGDGYEGSIQEIAAIVGYDDAYHFSKLFKKHFGITPSQARKKA